MSEWQPIETYKHQPFVPEDWYKSGEYVLVWNGHWCVIASYGYTKHGKGRWQAHGRNVFPTHWMLLPEPPK